MNNKREIFSRNFKRLLFEKKYGLNQREIAAGMGVHPSYISKWLSNIMPSTENLEKIANYLEVSAYELLHEPPAVKEDIDPRKIEAGGGKKGYGSTTSLHSEKRRYNGNKVG